MLLLGALHMKPQRSRHLEVSLNEIKPFTLHGGKGLGGVPGSYVAGYEILYFGD
jgi:hypothetical protein